MTLLAGTSGYSYKEWKGSFYPEDLPPAKMLSSYASRLSTVEINNTFYRMPSQKVIEGWAEQVPEDFTFVIKASNRITHMRRLKNTDDALKYLLETTRHLGAKLGPYLFQLPPNFKKDVPRLNDFLATIPDDRKATFEFRHKTWFDDETYDALRKYNVALCISDEAEKEVEIIKTADWGYFRLRREDYTEDDLENWSRRILAQKWDSTFVFFKHEVIGPDLAMRLKKLHDK